ncbi:MAG TPA: glycoside hydrolase family 97 protein [Bacteroidales bacterium]|nr:glycoside hydrolase family 97 protein [Bacteroidales bacterium]
MRNKLFLSALALCLVIPLYARDYTFSSPDKKIAVSVNADKGLSWYVTYNGTPVAGPCRLDMTLSTGVIPSASAKVKQCRIGELNNTLTPVVPHKNSTITDHCNQMTIRFSDGTMVIFRAYNDGVAYRFATACKDDIIVKNETFSVSLPTGTETWYPTEQSFMSHNERFFYYGKMDTIGKDHLASLPALFKPNGINLLITESDIEDYPGMWLRGDDKGGLTGVHPAYPDKEQLVRDRDLRVVSTKDYIASTIGTRTFPWRVFIISPDDGGLITSDMVYKLAAPCRLASTDWIKPGKVAWDWWNANNIYGVNFRAGLNNETYKYYIDFASANGIEYVILDEGWYTLPDVLKVAPGFDIPELCKYAASKNVGIILWVVWKSFDDQMEDALKQYAAWGVKGIKVDFMQRDDQWMVNYYWRVAKRAADYHMLVDFHGAYKPDGLERTFPNALTREGVKGLENDKWEYLVSPEHDVTLPFTRMVAGPMDYTPGAMVNMEKSNFHPMFTRPASQGTRVHQMAMYVVYESPLQMLADSPSNYKKEQECTTFIAGVPVTWDETRVLAAKTGDYLVIARRKGTDWYIGAMTDWTPRTLEVELPLTAGQTYKMEYFSDGINADHYASDYTHSTKEINGGEKLKIEMAPGGGWAAKISVK